MEIGYHLKDVLTSEKVQTLYNICKNLFQILSLTILHSERPKLYTILVFLSTIGLKANNVALLGSWG